MIQYMWTFCWTAVLARQFWKSYKLVCIKVQVASFRRNGQWFIRELSPLVLYSTLRDFSAGSPILPTNHQKWSLHLYGDLAASIWVTFNQLIWFVALLISHVSSRFVMMVMTIRSAKQSTTSKDTWGKPIRVTTISLLFIRIDCQHDYVRTSSSPYPSNAICRCEAPYGKKKLSFWPSISRGRRPW